ncbi:Protein CBG00754 [Caenorhabditis briggsae]|uniref:Protein CBG00754 n=2 Tax=Caenorhabditis briggsae TaxID=6238 RepID=A8WNR4_CAEBR|nr:Protein CBG00754 [Caenorhabditis briggsae]ULT86349.1 hypothetical protein L3Y34_006197 [Caenorhabditis briggsae]CAP22120.1 Protein CBG00754 [Caenorhabditis briggsae]
MIFFACVLFGLVFGYDGSECNPAEWYIAVKCSIKHGELLSQAKILDLKNDYNMRKINMTCTDFLKCSTQFKCGRTKKDVEEIEKAVFVCNFVAFLISPGFVDCVDKVDSKKSTCLQEWDPFPDLEGTEEENKVKQKEACRNFFGKDNCMEKEMVDMYSMDLWEDFRKHYLVLNKIFKACDFD